MFFYLHSSAAMSTVRYYSYRKLVLVRKKKFVVEHVNVLVGSVPAWLCQKRRHYDDVRRCKCEHKLMVRDFLAQVNFIEYQHSFYHQC